ncbi:non-homologous end joining protein Ku [Streptomyces pinistramenti]|uniref:non-homologous end joining protein Ku n=1 Tax=Streptomyces pinistramenti TaxID=2884812 RepID=UPI001D079805|nr:Ku protein [Streptomyces pinistramenti]MCB5910721.1 Ku protein [Streptomyces pinistramenti]
MRSVWNGVISFGLVSIPVKTYSATNRSSSVSFVRIHDKDAGRIQYRKFCELDGEEVPNEEIGKGYQAGDSIVPITDDDLSRLPLPTTKTLTILSFLDAGEIDPLQMDKSYYLGPNGPAAVKPYTLLREALEHHGKVAIGKVAMHGRETLAMLRSHDGAIVMHALLWPDQIRSTSGVVPDGVEIRENELTLAETLMDSLGELDPGELHDDYREAVEALVTAKLEGGEPVAPASSDTSGGQVIDLMAALESSVRAAQEGRGERAADEDEEPASVTPIRGRKTARRDAEPSGADKGSAGRGGTKKPAAAKAPAKKTAAKKTAASGARKPAAKKTAGGRAKADGSGAGSASSSAKSGTSGGTSAQKGTAKKAAAKKSGKRASA